MPTYIRLTDYKSSEGKERGFFKPENRYKAKQEDFEKIPGSPIAYWVSEKIYNLFNNCQKLGDIGEAKVGMTTADNDKFLRLWYEIRIEDIGFRFGSREEARKSNLKWFPYNKGGEFRKWFGNNEYVINWKNDGFDIKNNIGNNGKKLASVRSENLYFKESLTWSFVSSSSFGIRYSPQGFLFDNGGSSYFTNKNMKYILAFLTSKFSFMMLKIFNPTLSFQAGNIASLPIVFPKSSTLKPKIEDLTQQNIDISKEEWDSRETSWDFRTNELVRIKNEKLKMKNCRIKDAYNLYCEYWKDKFFQLHENEEELNRLFIEIYELQDELTSDVPLEDITILKNETKIVDGKLEFRADEIMKQFISYGVGVMFGRYSLDHKGLHIANMNESLEEVNSKFNIQNSKFEADDDNIIPVLEDDYFKDDITSRFVQFVKATFGEEHLSENVRFIERSLGTSLRRYFVKGFYEDHIKRYKKRPIYWMVSSPKKGFMSLIYMHRYKSDTFARVRNSYLSEYIAKLEAQKENLNLTLNSKTASNKDKKDVSKAIKKIEVKLKELIDFDRDVMMNFARDSFEIDLDDGVKINYCRFKDILYSIKGLCK